MIYSFLPTIYLQRYYLHSKQSSYILVTAIITFNIILHVFFIHSFHVQLNYLFYKVGSVDTPLSSSLSSPHHAILTDLSSNNSFSVHRQSFEYEYSNVHLSNMFSCFVFYNFFISSIVKPVICEIVSKGIFKDFILDALAFFSSKRPSA